MPEGDTLFRTAATLRKALEGREISRAESRMDALAAALRARPLTGRRVQAVEARGKHLLILMRKRALGVEPGDSDPMRVPDALALDLVRSDLVLHTHLRMTGSWHIYRHGEPWRKPASYAKIVLETEEFVAPCFSAPVVELLTAREAARHPELSALGPDAMTESFDIAEAARRLLWQPDTEIGVAIMNQRALAGVGNVFKSEVLFIRRLSPFTAVGALPPGELEALAAECHRLLRLNERLGDRRTRFTLNQRERLWVYGRIGRACRACGEVIRMRRQGVDGRTTYFCPSCQRVPARFLTAAD